MKLRPSQIFFLIVIIGILIYNSFEQFSRFQAVVERFRTDDIIVIGKEFVPLKPYLRKQSRAGFMSCLESSNPQIDERIAAAFSQAQYTLSPVILDMEHPSDYRFVLLHCGEEDKRLKIQEQLHARPVAQSARDMWLVDRRKP